MYTDLAMTALADYLLACIHQRGWSRHEAAARAGMSKTAITNIVNDQRRPSKETLAKIAAGWGLDLGYLLELAGIALADSSLAEQATAGLTAEQLAWLAALSPEQRQRIIVAGRLILGDEPPP